MPEPIKIEEVKERVILVGVSEQDLSLIHI